MKQKNLHPDSKVRNVARVARVSLKNLRKTCVPNPGMDGFWEEVEDGMGTGSMLLRVFGDDVCGGCEVEGGSGRSSIVVRSAVVMIVGPVDPRVKYLYWRRYCSFLKEQMFVDALVGSTSRTG